MRSYLIITLLNDSFFSQERLLLEFKDCSSDRIFVDLGFLIEGSSDWLMRGLYHRSLGHGGRLGHRQEFRCLFNLRIDLNQFTT
jgi:hypothetical protein